MPVSVGWQTARAGPAEVARGRYGSPRTAAGHSTDRRNAPRMQGTRATETSRRETFRMPPAPHRDRLQRRCSSGGEPAQTSDKPCTPDASLPAKLRAFHERLPLAGDPRNAVLSLPDDRPLSPPRHAAARAGSLAGGVAGVPRPPQAARGLPPPRVPPPRLWPEECRPPLEVTAYLDRVFLSAAARAMRAGRQVQAVVDALEAAGIESVKAVLLHLHRKRTGPPVSKSFASAERRMDAPVDPGGASALRVTGPATGG